MDVEGFRQRLRPVFAGRRVVLFDGVVQSKVGPARQLRELGSERCLVVGSMGTGDPPADEDAELVVVDGRATDLMDDIRRWERLALDPPAEVAAALDRYDPDRTALVLLGILGVATTVGGRPTFGARPRRWVALEDKATVDAVFDDAGVGRPPCEVVPVRADVLGAAARRLDRGAGTVWAGDARDGFHGGASLVHWVRTDADADAALAPLAARSDRARVAPFLEGVPCSIHGFVTGDGVARFRPVELLTLRSATAPYFHYAGAATAWDPPAADREAMRAVAERVGRWLAGAVGYRGGFTVDGVLSEDGFLATELNPRLGAALVYLRQALPALPLELLQQATVAGAVDVAAAALESVVVAAGDAHRTAAGWLGVPGRPQPTTERLTVELDGAGARGEVELGPSPFGTFARITFDPSSLPAGAPVAPAVAHVLTVVDERCGLGVGPLEAPRPVR
jgi:hypothetical protein